MVEDVGDGVVWVVEEEEFCVRGDGVFYGVLVDFLVVGGRVECEGDGDGFVVGVVWCCYEWWIYGGVVENLVVGLGEGLGGDVEVVDKVGELDELGGVDGLVVVMGEGVDDGGDFGFCWVGVVEDVVVYVVVEGVDDCG